MIGSTMGSGKEKEKKMKKKFKKCLRVQLETTWVKLFLDVPFKGRLLSVPRNIKLGRKRLSGTKL
jgi:hypothetical protein